MLGRELPIVLRSRVAWVSAALSALLIGHGFVLAVDLFSAGSRSASTSHLMARELDPLAGIVRPSFGGLYLALSLLGPLVAARAVAIEKERHGFAALLLQTRAPLRVLGAKYVAALLGVGLQLLAPIALLGLWALLGGHLAGAETGLVVLVYVVYAALVTAIAVMAAAFTASLAQAATLAVMLVAASWAIDASEGFAALAWLGRALDWSVTTHLSPMERGTLAVGALAWMLVVTAGALALAWIGFRADLAWRRRALLGMSALCGVAVCGIGTQQIRRAYDLTERHRASLPPAAVRGLARLPGRIAVEVYLDRDDARRRQLEADTLAKLRLARPDVDVEMPLDHRPAVAEGERQPEYGRILIHVGGVTKETYSTSQKELVTLIFEAAGAVLPSWDQPEYPGYPHVIEGARRTVVLAIAYAGLPILILVVGYLVTRPTRRRT